MGAIILMAFMSHLVTPEDKKIAAVYVFVSVVFTALASEERGNVIARLCPSVHPYVCHKMCNEY
jgi:hypothetical protein